MQYARLATTSAMHVSTRMPWYSRYESGSTDVGDVGYATPTVTLHVATAGLGNVGHSWQNTAYSNSSIGMKGMLKAAEVMALAAVYTMEQPELIEKARQELLRKNGGKYKIGIIANQNPGSKERLESFGILEYIDLIVASAEEGCAKPDSKIFEIALSRAGVQASDSVMIGDRIDNDIIPANEIGMKTVWVKQGYGKYWSFSSDPESRRVEKADFEVDDLSGLLKFF